MKITLLIICLFLSFSFKAQVTTTSAVAHHVTCPYGNDGKAYVTVTGGIGPYTYSWDSNPVQTVDTLFDAMAGTYICTITDQGDMSVSTETVTINDGTEPYPAILYGDGGDPGHPVCSGDPLNIYGSTTDITFSWTGPAGFSAATQDAYLSSVTPANAGYYYCTATSSTGCTVDDSIFISIAPPITVSISYTVPTCSYSCDGSANAVVSGGVGAPYLYYWSDSNNSTTASISNLCAGGYDVVITDNNYCQATAYELLDPGPPISITLTPTNPSGCNSCDGSILSTVSGGTPNYQYSWIPNLSNTANQSNLCAGIYTLTVLDASGCYATASTSLFNQGNLNPSISVIPDTCGHMHGAATVNVTGNQGSLTFIWQPGNFTTQSINNVAAGTYTLYVTDTVCSYSTLVTIPNLNAPATIVSSGAASCNNPTGSIVVSTSGGASPYQYSLNGNAFSSNTTYSNLAGGTYTIVTQDANGCQSTNVNLVQNQGLNLTFSYSNATCNSSNGSASVYVSGGTTPYTYSWNNGSNNQSITGLSEGTYTCTVTDNAGCIQSGLVNISSQATIYLGYDYTFSVCGVNSLTAQPNFGVSPYTYSWSPGGETTQSIYNNPAGTYTCTATDNNGCTATGFYYVYGGDYSIVSGTIYADLNSNCTFDAGENTNSYVYISASNSLGVVSSAVTYNSYNGSFKLYLPNTADTYTLSLSNPYNYNYSNVSFNCSNNIITLAGNCDTISGLELGYTPVVGQDLHVQGYCGISRPGFIRHSTIFYYNPGTTSINATVKMQMDNLLTFAGSTPPPSSINGNTIEWDFSNLAHSQYGYIYVDANIPTIQNGGALGTALYDSIWIEPTIGDNYLEDNYYACNSTIIGSYDPNSKEVYSSDMDINGNINTDPHELYYTVNFQNTGNDTAFTVVVLDSLSDFLDLSTLEVIAASHNFEWRILPDHTLQMEFDNILLPDSNHNETLSHGFFYYKIRTKPGLQAGDIINNTANIYFDYNPAIITNTVETQVVNDPVGVKYLSSQLNATIFPNPASDYFSIRINDASYKQLKLNVYNAEGSIVLNQKLPEKPLHNISTNGLSSGIYFYKVTNEQGKAFSGKFTLQK